MSVQKTLTYVAGPDTPVILFDDLRLVCREKAKKADELKVKLEEATKKIAKLESELEKTQATLEKDRRDAARKLEEALQVY